MPFFSSVLSTLLLLCCFTLCTQARAETLPNITVVTEEYPPYNYTEQGVVTGIATEILEEIFKILDIRPTISVYPWARSYRLAATQPNILIYSIMKTAQRSPLFKWLEFEIPGHTYFYKLKSRKDVIVEALDDTRRYTIEAVQKDAAAEFLERKNYPKIMYTKEYLNERMLLEKRIDLLLLEDIMLFHVIKGTSFTEEDFEPVFLVKELNNSMSMAFNLQTDDKVVARFQEALTTVQKSKRYQEILKKYNLPKNLP